MDAIKEHENKIRDLYNRLSVYIEQNNANFVANELYNYIWGKPGRKTKRIIKRQRINKILYLIKNLLQDEVFFDERLDYLCFFIKALGLADNADIPKDSIYTQQYMKYDPAKNAANIIKHSEDNNSNYFNGPSFREIISQDISDKIISTFYKNEDRYYALHKIIRDDIEKPILVIFNLRDNEDGYRVFSAKFLTKKGKSKKIRKTIKNDIKDDRFSNAENTLDDFKDYIEKKYLSKELEALEKLEELDKVDNIPSED